MEESNYSPLESSSSQIAKNWSIMPVLVQVRQSFPSSKRIGPGTRPVAVCREEGWIRKISRQLSPMCIKKGFNASPRVD